MKIQSRIKMIILIRLFPCLMEKINKVNIEILRQLIILKVANKFN